MEISANLSNFWTLNPAAQRNISRVANPHCSECGGRTSKPASCFYCDYVTCPACTRAETWGGEQVKVCKSCHEAGRAVDDLIKHEEKSYCKCRLTDAHACAVDKRLPGYAGYGHVLCDCYCHNTKEKI